MEGQELKDGKARVRSLLITPLERRGMERRRAVRLEEHQVFLASLEARLAYMQAEKLVALAEVVERHGTGKLKTIWPTEISIMNWARLLQVPPASESRLVRTYLQSGAGRAAREGGFLVELFTYLKKWGAPPNDYSMAEIRKEADWNRGKLAAIGRAVASGRATASETQWQQGYLKTEARCLDIINAKEKVGA
ncbi:hypothetical protein [Phaeobacter sp. B1627]|uniref:hypothetical protein n=1 Tax=Phaeobacter sp. B1627 TaxID=2583809 RepID=UPI00111AB172|nr:hypothetical protein [Phaeobacter sp. B1627]TNJ48098.1 hypothetical protein FGE21_02215 [Phaeobacter sp. B1627]